jgi:NAD(P)-dependent dehydrogenase (short-subunit alcohol dehydrogenase family)
VTADGDRRVVVVTGGGGGIGAAIAEQVARQGAHVVTLDPLVSVDGSEVLPAPEETTAGRIVMAGGSAQASSASVTDADAVRSLFEELVAERGRLDAVINVAGITRPTGFAKGRQDDWRDVLDVHLGGYVNVLGAALPIMARAGRGTVVGVTSGSGWRPADAGAYSCAKRAVASLTWQLGRHAPEGVTVNAISPIAVTRMVTAALARAGGGGAPKASTGGLSLGSMPEPDELGPLGAHLVAEPRGWCQGRVLFAGGSEVAVVDEPRLLEVVRTEGVGDLAGVLDAVVPEALIPAEARQAAGGGANPRFASAFGAVPGGDRPAPAVRRAAVIIDDAAIGDAATAALAARGIEVHRASTAGATDFGSVAAILEATAVDDLDAVVVAPAGLAASTAGEGWSQVVAEHAGLPDAIGGDAAWSRAVAEHAARLERPMRLVTLTDATTAGGRSRAQASAQLARASRSSTGDRVASFAVAMESTREPDLRAAGELTVVLLAHADGPELAGAELAVGVGWLGLRSHPRPASTFTLGGAAIPDWFDDVLREVLR